MTKYLDKLIKNVEEARQIKAILAMSGWKVIDNYFKETLNNHLNQLKKEKDIKKIQYSQAVIEVIEGLYNLLDAINKDAKEAVNLIKEYKKGG